MKLYHSIFTLLAGATLLLTACNTSDGGDEPQAGDTPMLITSSISPFDGDDDEFSRVNMDGTAFLTGDLMRLKIICPYSTDTELGESTYSNSFDNFWLQKWTGTGWTYLRSADGFDINGDSRPSDSRVLTSHIEAQATPYVYTASTWSVERKFFGRNGRLYLQYTPAFYADQTQEQNYRYSDILWAQTYMTTGTSAIHLEFRHVMSALKITLEGNTAAIAADATLSVEGMPDIDQAEIVVGDYYAAKSKSNSSYSYRDKSTCAYEDNGKVLGVGVNDDNSYTAYTRPMTGNPNPDSRATVPNDGIYTAYNAGSHTYRLIVPPCTLEAAPRMVLRSGTKRYTASLSHMNFEEGKLYNVTFNIPQAD